MYQRLKDLREDFEKSQREIAEKISTTQQQYSKIEKGKTEISSEKLIILAKYYNVSIDYILGLIDNPIPLNECQRCNKGVKK